MHQYLDFEFDNLPILTDLGFKAAPVDGSATISYNADGDWSVSEIWLNGSRLVGDALGAHGVVPVFAHKQIAVCPKAHPWLYNAIRDQLEEGAFKSTITDRVVQELDEMSPPKRWAS